MKTAFLAFLALSLASCASQSAQTTKTNQQETSRANVVTGKTSGNSPVISSSHSTESQSPQTLPPTSSTATDPNGNSGGRSPMERAIDTAEMDAAIEKAEKELKQKPTDSATKSALAEAYFVRATALTEAAQYRAALGDYRRGLKLEPANAEAKNMQDQIVSIFQSLNREPPKEGTEPPPLPFKKA